MSSLFVDTLNELDKTACNILTTVQNNPPTKNIKLKDISWNHSIVGVKEDNNLILFDPVSKHFVNPYNIEETKIIEKYRAGLIDDGNLKKYYLISNDHEFFNTSQTKKKLKITYNPIKTINYNEYLYLVEYIKNIYFTNISLALEFYKSQNSKMRKITELKKELSPYSDQKITSWLVKK